ncbi:MAG TPA: tRNA (adenosine(37)-N6)-threonylcarbamoyltransferase complex dimerization subunit type 1 TsaB [Pseudomonadaceae bacterium]|nr:tRNA (adenosine(37)-N6)-threonylcarbamoyltransferase complex dimerization subunit type 1 TsaB [Pseudomonadaceae bacterium]
MAVILALDTSTEACSCALLGAGEGRERFVVKPREHTQLLLPMIEDLLAECGMTLQDLDAVAFGRGPGSFTGLRIAAGVTQGLAFALDLPVVPVSTLAALALQGMEAGQRSPLSLACIDARIEEVYWAWFRTDGELPQLLGDEILSKPEALVLPATYEKQALAVFGSGLHYRARMPRGLVADFASESPQMLPRAIHIGRLAQHDFNIGKVCRADEASPVYLRDKVTHG